MAKPYVSDNQILSVMVAGMIDAMKTIQRKSGDPPVLKFRKHTVRKGKPTEKELDEIDTAAERGFREYLSEEFKEDVQVIGEESLAEVTPTTDGRVCVLVDVVDGTDLLEMDIPLWCCAAIAFNAKDRRIVASVISLASGEIYKATEKEVSVQRDPHSRLNDVLRGPSGVTSLRKARLAFYGQKAKNFLSLYDDPGILAGIRKQATLGKKTGFRIYNFAGNPMMVRMVDRIKDENNDPIGCGIDLIFDLGGQYAHDVLPGAYIAKKAGAYFCDLAGKEITEERMVQLAANPLSKVKYILAATRKLGKQMSRAISDGAAVDRPRT